VDESNLIERLTRIETVIRGYRGDVKDLEQRLSKLEHHHTSFLTLCGVGAVLLPILTLLIDKFIKGAL